MADVRPLLIAVLSAPRPVSLERLRDSRLRIAVYVREEGYSLLETFEVIGDDESVYERLATMTDRSEASTILICGARVDRYRVDAIAAAAGMRVVELPAERPVFAPRHRSPPKRRGPS